MEAEPIYAPDWPNLDDSLREFVAMFPGLPLRCAVCGCTGAERVVYGRFVREAPQRYRCEAAFCLAHMPDDWYARPPEPHHAAHRRPQGAGGGTDA